MPGSPLARDARALSALIRSLVFTSTSTITLPPEPEAPPMAAAKKSSPAKGKSASPAKPKGKPAPDRALVAQVSGEITQRLEAQFATPPGVYAAPGDFLKKLSKLVPTLLTTGLELAGMATDGRLDLDEARRVGELVLEFIAKVREQPANAVGGTSPSNAPSPTPAA